VSGLLDIDDFALGMAFDLAEDPPGDRDRLEPREPEEVRDILLVDPVFDRCPRLQPRQFEHAECRPPELAVGVDDDARVTVRMPGNAVEKSEQVIDVRHEVGENDVVEGRAEVRILGRAGLEAKSGMPAPCGRNHLRADVDPDTLPWLEGREEIAGAATELQHRGTRRHDCLVNRLHELVIAGARPPPARASGCEVVERLHDVGVRGGTLRHRTRHCRGQLGESRPLMS
jgi:hypothetical protein